MPSKYRGAPKEVLALSTFVKLTRAVNALGSRLAPSLQAEDLTESQFGVLEALHHIGPMHQCDLARKILKSSGNMTMVVDNLERRGLVRRERSSEDRRFVEVQLTPEGERIIRRIFPGHARAITEEMGRLSEPEQRLLGQLCRRLGRGAEIEAER
jgi:MarR family 2-MHQ and catechol resistance regulon transcriptional repressor